jgi:hypothetical protein
MKKDTWVENGRRFGCGGKWKSGQCDGIKRRGGIDGKGGFGREREGNEVVK